MSIDEEIENYINSANTKPNTNAASYANNSANNSPTSSNHGNSNIMSVASNKAYHNPRKQSMAEEPSKLFLGDYVSQQNGGESSKTTNKQQPQSPPFLFNNTVDNSSLQVKPVPEGRRNTADANISTDSPHNSGRYNKTDQSSSEEQEGSPSSQNTQARALPVSPVQHSLEKHQQQQQQSSSLPSSLSASSPSTQQPGRSSRPGPSLPERQGSQGLHQRTLPNPKIQRIVPNTPSKGMLRNDYFCCLLFIIFVVCCLLFLLFVFILFYYFCLLFIIFVVCCLLFFVFVYYFCVLLLCSV
jgi:hypothetical protein